MIDEAGTSSHFSISLIDSNGNDAESLNWIGLYIFEASGLARIFIWFALIKILSKMFCIQELELMSYGGIDDPSHQENWKPLCCFH